MFLASLPWYDLDEIRWATDALWSELAGQLSRAGLANVPRRLNRDVHYEQQWTSPHFLFGQACGYDVRIANANRLRVVATPRYAAAGCLGSTYSSFVVVRDDAPFERLEDLRGTRCVVNTPTSHSGMNVLRALVAPLHSNGRFFSQVKVSGSHARSLRMILSQRADVAAIDCVTHCLLATHRPSELWGTRVVFRTQPVPAPPYVTGASLSTETVVRLRAALRRALQQPSLDAAKDALLLQGVQMLPGEAYRPIEKLAAMAHEHDYREIPGTRLATI